SVRATVVLPTPPLSAPISTTAGFVMTHPYPKHLMVNIRPGYGEIMARAKLKDIPVVNGGPSLYSFWRLRTTRPSLVPRDGKRVRRRRPRPHQFNSATVRDGSLDGGADRRNRLVGHPLPPPEPALHDFIGVYGVPGESDF